MVNVSKISLQEELLLNRVRDLALNLVKDWLIKERVWTLQHSIKPKGDQCKETTPNRLVKRLGLVTTEANNRNKNHHRPLTVPGMCQI